MGFPFKQLSWEFCDRALFEVGDWKTVTPLKSLGFSVTPGPNVVRGWKGCQGHGGFFESPGLDGPHQINPPKSNPSQDQVDHPPFLGPSSNWIEAIFSSCRSEWKKSGLLVATKKKLDQVSLPDMKVKTKGRFYPGWFFRVKRKMGSVFTEIRGFTRNPEGKIFRNLIILALGCWC